MKPSSYRGRLAPSPTGLLHLGHARTFWIAHQRCRERDGTLVLRNEDLDRDRCQAQFVTAMLEDLRWIGLHWEEGPDCGGPFAPYAQSERRKFYLNAFNQLVGAGLLYPCVCSRRDVLRALQAPHAGEDEPIYPGTCRGRSVDLSQAPREHPVQNAKRINWRLRVPDGEEISFQDGHSGTHRFVAGHDFGDFIVWRHDDIPAYQLAVTVDDAAMRISEVVRGEDLLKSTARQLLIYRALGLRAPEFYHCPLVTDAAGVRLAKRHDALSLRALRQAGKPAEEIRLSWPKT